MAKDIDPGFDALESKVQLRRRARADGAAGRPAAEDGGQSDAERDIAAAYEASRQRFIAARAGLAADLNAQMTPPVPFDAETPKAQALLALTQAEAQARLGCESTAAAAKDANAALAAFRETHHRGARAHYPRSGVLAVALLAAAALLEATFSASLLADADEHGLLGGAVKAIGLSGANVAFGFLAGFLGFRYVQHVRLPWRAAGLAALLAFTAVAAALNLYAATWRQEVQTGIEAQTAAASAPKIAAAKERCVDAAARKASGAEDALAKKLNTQREGDDGAASLERIQARRDAEIATCNKTAANAAMLAAPQHTATLGPLSAPQAIVLLMLGAAVFVFAALKGYSGVDDPYPDYGKLARGAEAATEARTEALQAAHVSLSAALAPARAKLDADLQAAQDAHAKARKAFDAAAVEMGALAARWRAQEQIFARLFALYAQENRAARKTPAPARFDDAPAPTPLPDALAEAAPRLQEGESRLGAALRAHAGAQSEMAAALSAAMTRLETL